MPDPIEPTPAPAPPRPRRSRKFVLPDHHHDERDGERTDEHIEAFLDAPVARRRRPRVATRPRRPVELDTRPDWLAALRHEAGRHARYGRPASVLLIELTIGDPPPPTVDRLAHAVADAIRVEARESDRAVRLGARSFRLLLPETGDRAAHAVADRLDRVFLASADARAYGADLTIDIATPARHGTLDDALADAERRHAVRCAGADPAQD